MNRFKNIRELNITLWETSARATPSAWCGRSHSLTKCSMDDMRLCRWVSASRSAHSLSKFSSHYIPELEGILQDCSGTLQAVKIERELSLSPAGEDLN